MPQININIKINSFMLIISTKMIEIKDKMMMILALRRHCLLGTLRFLLSPVIPVKPLKIPEIAINRALAITKNFGVERLSDVVVKIKIHINTLTTPEIVRKILVIIKNADLFLFIK